MRAYMMLIFQVGLCAVSVTSYPARLRAFAATQPKLNSGFKRLTSEIMKVYSWVLAGVVCLVIFVGGFRHGYDLTPIRAVSAGLACLHSFVFIYLAMKSKIRLADPIALASEANALRVIPAAHLTLALLVQVLPG